MRDPDDPHLKERFKYALLLNLDASAEVSFVCLTTSRLDKTAPFQVKFPNQYHELAVGAYEWVTEPTVINLGEYKTYRRVDLLAAFKSGTLAMQCLLKPEDLAAIDTKLRASRTIERRTLRLIVS